MSSTPSVTNTGKAQQPARRRGTPRDAGTLLREAFDDIALVIGGAAAVNRIDDDLTWTLLARIDRIRLRLLQELKGLPGRNLFEPRSAWPPRVHPAVEAFLAKNRAEVEE
jgi:hypothetical protein